MRKFFFGYVSMCQSYRFIESFFQRPGQFEHIGKSLSFRIRLIAPGGRHAGRGIAVQQCAWAPSSAIMPKL